MSQLGGSLWLVPDPLSSCSTLLSSKINELAQNDNWGIGVAQSFSPHMTITSGITDYFLSSARKIEFPGYSFVHLDEIQLSQPEMKVKEVIFGDSFFKRIFIRLERTESLLRLVSTLRSQFVGESQDSLDEFMASFDPHISLAYGEGFASSSSSNDPQWKTSLLKFAQSLDLKAFQFIVLMDTRSQEKRKPQNQVNDWKACPIRLSL